MKIIFTLCALVLSVCGAAQAAEKSPYDDLMRESRIVRDLAEFDPQITNSSYASAWIIADVVPIPTSGWVVGVERDADGEITKIPPLGTKASMRIKGGLENLSILGGTYKGETEYEWLISGMWSGSSVMIFAPMRMGNGSRPQPERRPESYSPFTQGGTAVLGVRTNAVDTNPFAPVFLIPEDWREFVATAPRERWGKAVLPKTSFPASEEKMRRQNDFEMQLLLTHQNPFVAITAAREILRADSLDSRFVENTLAPATGYKQALFTYMVLNQLQRSKYPRADEEAVEAISSLVERATNSEMLRWIALGAYAARGNFLIEDETKATPAQQQSRLIMQKISEKQLLLGADMPADQYLDELLKVTRVRKR